MEGEVASAGKQESLADVVVVVVAEEEEEVENTAVVVVMHTAAVADAIDTVVAFGEECTIHQCDCVEQRNIAEGGFGVLGMRSC